MTGQLKRLDCCEKHNVPTVPMPETEGARTGAFEFFLSTFVLSSNCLSLFVSFISRAKPQNSSQVGLGTKMRGTGLARLTFERYTFRDSWYTGSVRA